MILSKAYWITPEGEILDIGLDTHIAYIISHPIKFNITKNTITELYKKYNEIIPIEGITRKEIIMHLLVQGYIRIRQYKTHWSISLNKWNNKNQETISKWAYIAADIKNAGRYMPVIISTLNGSKYNYTVENLYSPVA